MSAVKKGTLTSARERWKHLRKFNKRLFWSAERRAYKEQIRKEMQ